MIKKEEDLMTFFMIFGLMLTIFVFSSDGHRYSSDEDFALLQTQRIVTQEPHPLYAQGESTILFEYPEIYRGGSGPTCKNAIICSPATIGNSVTEVPFFFINHNFHIITEKSVIWSIEDFRDNHYVFWRNSIDPDFTFTELFYGPVFSALSVSIFFLICRTFEFTQKTSLILTLLFGLSTTVWAYSQTSSNAVPMMTFILLGFLFFRKFQNFHTKLNLIFSASFFGFAFLVRLDAILFILPMIGFFLYQLRDNNKKIKKIISFFVPLLIFYGIYQLVVLIRFGTSPEEVTFSAVNTITQIGSGNIPIYEGVGGLLLSPGVGLFIFAPILLTMFFSFPDFFKKNKNECILFLSFLGMFLLYYGPTMNWHGLVAWGARYLLPTIPFLLLPLGASIDRRKNNFLRAIIISLGVFGFIFNIVYLIQDVAWFVWGRPGYEYGLYALGKYTANLYIHDAVIWTFEYSQITHSIIVALTNLQLDIFLIKVLGLEKFMLIFSLLIIPQIFFLYKRIIKNKDKIKGFS